ncbi:MAG: nitrophenyl compound nitroreductase subunit ArsF family protein [Flavobacteriaceae bacterium]|nr:nitrophenyl compound nitroreductase subunit ArsF family protein [Flavobacteriaceae bacterium]
MKAIKIFSLFVFSLMFTFCNGQDKKEITKQSKSISKIEVLDFHSTHRCMTCNAIEANTRYTLETYFNNEMKEGKITFQTVNVDQKENGKLAEKFEAAGTSLFLNVVKNGEEKQINLTDFAFMKGNDKKAFSTELKSKIQNELEQL